MVAFGKQPERFVLFEFVQANRALQSTFSDFEILDFGVGESGECLDDGCIETTRRRGASGAQGERGADAPAGAGLGPATDVDGEEAHEEESRD